MSEGVTIRGVADEIRYINARMTVIHGELKNTSIRVSADLLKKAIGNAPYREGTLTERMSERVIDHGKGNGVTIILSAGDTIYANRMHESHYQAYPRQEVTLRRSRKTGRSYYKYNRGYRTAGGFWIDSAGNRHGRKYLTRALKDNYPRYLRAFAALGDRH